MSKILAWLEKFLKLSKEGWTCFCNLGNTKNRYYSKHVKKKSKEYNENNKERLQEQATLDTEIFL